MPPRVVTTGTPGKLTRVRPQDVPNDLRNAYFGIPYNYGVVNPSLMARIVRRVTVSNKVMRT